NPRFIIFAIDRAHRVEMETDDAPLPRMLDQNGVEFLGHDIITRQIGVLPPRDPYPVPKPVMDLLNAIVSVGVQGAVPMNAPTVGVERSSVKNMQSLARNHSLVRAVRSLVQPAQDLTSLRRRLPVDGFLGLHTDVRSEKVNQGHDEQHTRDKGSAGKPGDKLRRPAVVMGAET